jgi:hypothetical protein
MHPFNFYDQIWNGETENIVFVAMSFDGKYQERFEKIFKPAIESIEINGNRLTAVRVDERKTGDSIILEIVKGIAVSEIILADISSMDIEFDNNGIKRNGNVMYELGLAHAVKSPEKVLIVRDDNNKLLFDVSSIPCKTIDFTSIDAAKNQVANLIVDRIKQSEIISDYKLKIFSTEILEDEVNVLKKLSKCPVGKAVDLRINPENFKQLSIPDKNGLEGLRAKGLIKTTLFDEDITPYYSLNRRGRKLFIMLKIIKEDNWSNSAKS